MKQREKCSGRGFDSRQVHHKESYVMLGYVLFLAFWVVFGVGYLTRDKSLDAEKLRNYH